MGQKQPRVVIVGAGFAGLWAARALAHSGVDVLIVDRNNYHAFLPLLYQVAAAELEPEEIIFPIRSILHKYPNIGFRLAEITGIDTANRRLLAGAESILYDYLVLAIGSQAHFFNVPGAAEHAFALKTMDDAVLLRNHILCRFEAAMTEADASLRRQMLTFTIVGGGPTGVEFAGALAELVRTPLRRDYPNLDVHEVKIVLLEAAPRLLSGMPVLLHNYTIKRMQRMGVEVQLNAAASEITSQSVALRDGRVIPTETVVWTAGVHAASLPRSFDFPTLPNGQVSVLSTLQVAGHPEVYVTGDLAHVEQDSQPLLLIAPVATQEGEWTSKNILRQVAGKEPLPFRYRDPGMMAVVGRNAAVVRLGKYSFTGFPAWLIWLSVHLYRLIGFRNRLLVLVNWAWDYLFFEHAVRLILPLPTAAPSEKGC